MVERILKEDLNDWQMKVVPRKDGLFILQVFQRGKLLGKRTVATKDREEISTAVHSIMKDVDVGADDGSVTQADAPIPLANPKETPFSLVSKKQKNPEYTSP